MTPEESWKAIDRGFANWEELLGSSMAAERYREIRSVTHRLAPEATRLGFFASESTGRLMISPVAGFPERFQRAILSLEAFPGSRLQAIFHDRDRGNVEFAGPSEVVLAQVSEFLWKWATDLSWYPKCESPDPR